MNRKEAARLLELIQLAYPYAYRDMEDTWKRATINMWAASFPNVPYAIAEQCFNAYRMRSKYPPTVADMAAELRTLHLQAEEAMLIHRSLGNAPMEAHFRALMTATDLQSPPIHTSLPSPSKAAGASLPQRNYLSE